MTPADLVLLLDGLLAAALVALAVVALFASSRVVSVVFFLILGLVLALVWARLGAPDVALAEAAVGAGLTGALLLDAVRRPAPPTSREATWQARGTSLVAVALAVPLAVLVARAAATLVEGPGDGAAVQQVLPSTGVEHPVTAVLLNLRSYDTLLEVAVLLVGALALLGLHHDDDLADVPLPPPAEPVVRGLVAVTVPAALLVAGWLLVSGTSAPGGAFQAGALLAGALVLVRLAGRRAPAPGRRSLRLLLAAGTAVFLAVALTTALAGGGLLVLDPAWAKPAILAVEAALMVSIAVSLAEMYVADRPSADRAPR